MKKLFTVLFAVLLLTADAFAGPVITNTMITASTGSTATITWTTSTASTSQLVYGTDLSLPYSNIANVTLTTSHTMTLTLLSPGPIYYVAPLSKDSTGPTQAPAISFSICGSPIVSVQGTANNYYQYGNYTLTWIPPTGAVASPTVCGAAVQTTVTGKMDGGASFNDQVADASKIVPGPGQWAVTVADRGNIAPVTINAYLSQLIQNVSLPLQVAAGNSGLQFCLTNTLTSAFYPTTCGSGSGGGGVVSLNTLTGAVTLVQGSGITLSTTGNAITISSTGGGGGVSSFNTLTGPVTISQGNNVTFNTTGNNIAISSVQSVGLTMPSWLAVANSPLTGPGTLAVTPAASQTSHQVIGTCNTATTFAPCALVAGDIPALQYINAITGDVMASGAGSVAGTVRGLNGTNLASLPTGLLQNTGGTGIPVIATGVNVSGNGQFGGYVAAGVYIVPCTTTPVFDFSQGNLQILTLTTGCGTVTSSSVTGLPTSIDDVRHATVRVCQDSNGGHTFPDPTWTNGWNSPNLGVNQCTDTIYTVSNSGVVADGYNAAFCAVSGAGPLACGHAVKGFGTIPAGTNPTTTVNTTAIGATSIVDVRYTTAIGSSVTPTVTCDTTQPASVYWALAGTVSGTSFGVAATGTFTNPVCFTYIVVNP